MVFAHFEQKDGTNIVVSIGRMVNIYRERDLGRTLPGMSIPITFAFPSNELMTNLIYAYIFDSVHKSNNRKALKPLTTFWTAPLLSIARFIYILPFTFWNSLPFTNPTACVNQIEYECVYSFIEWEFRSLKIVQII